jgi:dTDP-4-amino-4,6-dideoxygalactose transaminase
VVNHPFYRSIGYGIKAYPVAARYYKETISLPIFPDLTKKDLIYVITNIKEVLCKYAE